MAAFYGSGSDMLMLGPNGDSDSVEISTLDSSTYIVGWETGFATVNAYPASSDAAGSLVVLHASDDYHYDGTGAWVLD